MKKIVIVDIDGTLLNISDRVALKKPFITKEEDLHYYDRDFPNTPVVETVKGLVKQGYQIVFCSGRTEIGMEKTAVQIMKCLPGVQYKLYMRKDGDLRPDSVVKSEFLEIIGKQNVLFCIDDRQQVVDYWRSVGLVCFQVAEGNF